MPGQQSKAGGSSNDSQDCDSGKVEVWQQKLRGTKGAKRYQWAEKRRQQLKKQLFVETKVNMQKRGPGQSNKHQGGGKKDRKDKKK